MIEYIRGELTELTPALATVEAAGVGYGLNISLNTFTAIQSKKEVKLYVYEIIREDTHLLYGFYTKTPTCSTASITRRSARCLSSSSPSAAWVPTPPA